MADDLVQRLRESAIEIASAGHYGWGNACTSAADEIERLRACLKYEEHRFATQSTHSEGCHSFGPSHYECALQEVERLRADVAEAKRRASSAEFELNCLEQVRLRDNQYLIDRAEKAERELAALRERIEKAPVGIPRTLSTAPVTRDIIGIRFDDMSLYPLAGKRVRLLVEE